MKKNNLLYLLLAILIIIIVIITIIFITNKNNNKNLTEEELETINLKATKVINETSNLDFASLVSKKDDETALLISNTKNDKIVINVRESSIIKESGTSTNYDKTLSNGLNSAVIVSTNTTVKFYTSKIITNSDKENALFIGGTQSTSFISDTEITTKSNNSNGITVASNGHVETDNLFLKVEGSNSNALQATVPSSNIIVTNSNIETYGTSSPIIESIGNVTLKNTTATTYESNFANINDGTLILDGTTIKVAAQKEKTNPNAFHITGTNNINITSSSLNIDEKSPVYKSAVMFLLNNSNTNLNITSTEFNIGSNKLLSINNSTLNLNLTKQEINTDIQLDNNSSLTINLKDNSTITSKINNNKDKQVKITLDKTSKIILKENTYIKELNNENKQNTNIITNGYHLYVNNKLVK